MLANDARIVKVIQCAPNHLMRLELGRLDRASETYQPGPCEHSGKWPTIKRCGRCRLGQFCSRLCQVVHWSAHRRSCELLIDLLLPLLCVDSCGCRRPFLVFRVRG